MFHNDIFLGIKGFLSLIFILLCLNLPAARQFKNTSDSYGDNNTVHDTLIKKTDYGIVNIGYDTIIKKMVTGSVTRLTQTDFNKGYIQNPLQLIQGRISGLSISRPGSDPNGSFYVRTRGINTIYGITGPLIVVDGIPDASLENVDPDDIESIDLLKDCSSAAIYGVRGSGGVIIVTTREGKAGTPVIEYNTNLSAEMVAANNPAMTSGEWRKLSEETGKGTDFGENTDWFKEIEQTAFAQIHNISMSGGTEKTCYSTSVGYRDGNGILLNTGYSQLNGRAKITQKAFNGRLILDLNLGATERKSRYGFGDAFHYASIFNPTAPVKSDDQNYNIYDGYFQQPLFDYYNPVSICELNRNEGESRFLDISLRGSIEIIKGLKINTLFSNLSRGSTSGMYYDRNDYWIGMSRNGLAIRKEDNSYSHLFESFVNYSKSFTERVNISFTGGYSFQNFINEGFLTQGGNFITDAFSFNNLGASQDFKDGNGIITSYKNSNRLVSFFGRANLDFHNLLYATACVRYEGSSRFGSSNKFGTYHSLGAGIDLSELFKIRAMKDLRFRLGFGLTGNQPDESYTSLLQLGSRSYYFYNYYYYQGYGNYYYYNGKFMPGYEVVNNSNPGLKHEKTGELNAGIDFSFSRHDITGSFDFYSRKSSDMLYRFMISVPPGLYDYQLLNGGKIRNRGMELTLNFNVIRNKNWSYNISFCSSYNSRSKLISLSSSFNGEESEYKIIQTGYLESNSNYPVIRVEKGKSLGQIIAWKYKGIDKNGNLELADSDKDGYPGYADIKVVGNGLPRFQIGFGNSFSYRSWMLSLFFRGIFGHDLINSYRAIYEAPGLITLYNVPAAAAGLRNPGTGTLMNRQWAVFSDRDVENSSFISLQNLCLQYSFRLKKPSHIRKISIYFAGNNLFYITGYKGSDPEPRYADTSRFFGRYNDPLVPGIDRLDSWPRTRSYSFGADIVF